MAVTPLLLRSYWPLPTGVCICFQISIITHEEKIRIIFFKYTYRPSHTFPWQVFEWKGLLTRVCVENWEVLTKLCFTGIQELLLAWYCIKIVIQKLSSKSCCYANNFQFTYKWTKYKLSKSVNRKSYCRTDS